MFINEYTMDRKRYDKWATPKFWRLRTFYLYLVLFAAGVFGWIYFDKVNVSARWQTIGAFLIFVAVYRGVFFHWIQARQKYFNEKYCLCKFIVRDKDISLHINGKLNNRVEWSDIKKLEEAKTYFKLTSPDGVEGVMLDKECFTEGNADSFKEWMLNVHPEIEQVPIAPAFNK